MKNGPSEGVARTSCAGEEKGEEKISASEEKSGSGKISASLHNKQAQKVKRGWASRGGGAGSESAGGGHEEDWKAARSSHMQQAPLPPAAALRSAHAGASAKSLKYFRNTLRQARLSAQTDACAPPPASTRIRALT